MQPLQLPHLPAEGPTQCQSIQQADMRGIGGASAGCFELCHSLTAGRGLSAARQLCNCLTYAQDKLNFHHTCSRGMQCHVARCLRSIAGVALKWLPPAAGYKTYCHPVQSGASCPAFLHIQGVQPQAGLQLLFTGSHPAYLCAGVQLKFVGAGLQERGIPPARRGDAPCRLRGVQQPPATAL